MISTRKLNRTTVKYLFWVWFQSLFKAYLTLLGATAQAQISKRSAVLTLSKKKCWRTDDILIISINLKKNCCGSDRMGHCQLHDYYKAR